ncbi:hypothetical protein F1C76_15555 [Geodermatophilaceae bacterium NBWT11]|nr:hypothetical protein F1C76_15555 [Geodermatophilaceae bacterium NBWT11]
MGRRGWVAAEDAAGDWWRLSVFDDGWVELPGFARGLSDTRSQLRQLLFLLAAFTGLFVLGGLLEDTAPALATGLRVAALVVLVGSTVQIARFRARDRRQLHGDLDQAAAARGAGRQVRARAGARLWRVAGSSQEMADALEGVRRVGSEQVSTVEVTAPDRPSESDPVVVVVRLHDGEQLTYRTPDRVAADLFAPWTP